MRLLLIRHGESEVDRLRVHEGRADYPLTARGRAQAQVMSEYLREHYAIGRIYHSPLRRAVETAQILAGATGAPLIVEQDLMEFDNGLIRGLTFQEADERYPKLSVPLHTSVYEQESILMFRYRAEYMLSKLLTENEQGDTVAVVTHGGMIQQMYCAFLKFPMNSELSFVTGDAGLHEWLIVEDSRCVVRANYQVGQADEA